MTSGLLATTGKFVEERQATALAVVAAIDVAGRDIKANPREVASIFLASEKSSLSPDQIEKMLAPVAEGEGS